MFLGHAFAALAIGVAVARLAGGDDATALSLGVVAAAAAILPDLDLLVGAGTYLVQTIGPGGSSWEGLWGTSNAIHRGLSHTLLGGVGIATVLAGTAMGRRHGREDRPRIALAALTVALAVGLGVIWIARKVGGTSELLALAIVLAGAVVLGAVVAPRMEIGGIAIAGAALLGVLSHPFGDVFMSTPPRVFYPLYVPFLTESVRLASDPTLNLLAISFVELGTIWAGVLALANATRTPIRPLLSPWAGLGLAYPLLMVFLPRPTMTDAHWLGFTLVPFGLVGLLGFLGVFGRSWRRSTSVASAAGTALGTVTVAALAYLLAYGFVFRV